MSGSGRPSRGPVEVRRRSRPREVARRLALGVAYWGAVLAVSFALVLILLLFFESRDASQLRDAGDGPGGVPGAGDLTRGPGAPRAPGGLTRGPGSPSTPGT